MRLSLLLVVLPFALALHAAAQGPAGNVSAPPAAVVPSNALTNQDVVKLSKIGIGDEAVIAKIHQAPTVEFALETDDLAALKTAGVSGRVIAAMLNRASGAPAGPVIVSPESVRAMLGHPGAVVHPGQPVLDASEAKKTLTMHTGEYRQNGFAGFGSTFWTYSGARSAVRTADRHAAVIMQSDTAPQEQVFFAKLEVDRKDNDRSVKIGSLLKGGNPFSDKTSAKPDPDWTVPYDATEISAGFWRLVPKADLLPGEYGIYLKQGFLFDFGVD